MDFSLQGEPAPAPGLHFRAVSRADKRARQRENKEAARVEREAAIRRARRRRGLIRALVALVAFAAVITLLNVARGDDKADENEGAEAAATTTTVAETTTAPSTAPPATLPADKTYTAAVTTNLGVIEITLDNENAPIATAQFVRLAREGFYDGLTWHRAVPDFVIQGGDPNGDGTGGSGASVVGEVPSDNYPIGSLAAAKAGNDPPGTFDSQFFIVTGPNGETLPNEYARFGTVTAGLEVAQEIEALAPGGDGPPTEPATIERIEITES